MRPKLRRSPSPVGRMARPRGQRPMRRTFVLRMPKKEPHRQHLTLRVAHKPLGGALQVSSGHLVPGKNRLQPFESGRIPPGQRGPVPMDLPRKLDPSLPVAIEPIEEIPPGRWR